MLERAACVVEQVAASEEDFWRQVDADDEGWLLRPVADECRKVGKLLADGQCYAFTTLPIFGGEYTSENIWVAHWEEWFAVTADIFLQIKDLPDGTPVSFGTSD